MKIIGQTLIVFLFIGLAGTAFAGPPANVDRNGVGIQGYDPVAFVTDGKPVLGKEEFHSTYHGVIYHFASAEHQIAFEQSPATYEPQFGGYCAYGVAQKHLAPVKIDAFQVVNGRLLMQYDASVRDTFNKDQSGNLQVADKNWRELFSKQN
ncbi:MAG TPA: YHS domain-containing (seleno)protein [Candidatus Udaeobacter sp.]|jgi:YHS domain-containing protein|nr:YHS domain-containing (seleno)protein [Candidatus Udaeobacter sp.]